MAKNLTRDMTVGSPMKLILGFSIPLLLGFLCQQFYSVVDTIIVGQFLGVEALAGVGATGSVNFMVIGFCSGVCSGFAIPVAQKFGAKDYSAMRAFVANSAWLSMIFAFVMTIVVALLCRNILTWMNTPEDIFENAYSYILIIFLGIPATYLYNILSGIIRSMGDSRTPLLFLLLSSGLNIGLDVLCIVAFKMGVAGAAVATVVSQLISGLLCLYYMIKKFEILHITGEEWRVNHDYMKILCGMGIPMGLQYSITAIGGVVLQTSVNTLGSLAVASVTAGGKVSMFFSCPFEAMGSTMATYGGQNVGAKKLERLDSGLKACILLGACYSLIALVVMYFFGADLAMLFVDAGEVEILANARKLLVINSAFFIPLALVNIIRFMIQGMGFSTFAILAGVFEMIARTLTGLILVPMLGFTGACCAGPMAWVFADAFLIPAYIHVRRKLQRMMAV
ncbi:MATE family efflux transporter [Parablautia intestinalis]|uniref:MATE family efflux transporter n=2 Tax=Parablautia intestinalis TaxID=2320100 RepID=UPI0023C5FD8A|nr:MATE family efflux transporter [Parablautia intestinalis]MDE7047352.1 MATE family efflux transporter [Lachnospiraceae bacterium]